MRIVITLPFLPPSVNKAYANVAGRGRIKTRAYRQFQHDCGYFIVKALEGFEIINKGGLTGDLAAEYNFYYPLYFKNRKRRKVDMANFEKSLTDTLVEYGVIADDSLIRRMVMESYDSEKEETVIEIKSLAS